MIRHMQFVLVSLVAVFFALSSASAVGRVKNEAIGAEKEVEYVEEQKTEWVELEVTLPPAPVAAQLQSIYVSAVATHQYLIDGSSLSVGNDGVVRYVLVVRTEGGAENVSYEGIRCEEGTWKLYATGAADGQWKKARISEWRPIENKSVNRYHMVLSRELFCPNGMPIATAEEGRRALRLGHHPDVKQ